MDQKREVPGAAATAAGTEIEAHGFKTEGYARRARAATALCLAIAECEQADAVVLLEGVLWRLRAGGPIPYFDDVRRQAKDWARFATPIELKAYAWESYKAMDERDQRGFIRAITRRTR